VGWGRGGVEGRRRYGGDNYDVNEDEQQEPTVATLRMPGIYVQQVCYHLHHYMFILFV